MIKETRSNPRKILRCPAQIQLQGASMRGRTIEISLSGLAVTMPEQMQPGQGCKVIFDALIDGKTSRITADANVVYSILSGTEGFRIGLKFAQIDAATNKLLAALMT
jgi:c-di-GMP-binding flagellar brake protein YcgR